MTVFPSKVATMARLGAVAVLGMLALQAPAQSATNPAGDLREHFVHPPADARPMMRWWWFGPAVTKPELEKELVTMQKAGIGGVEIQPVYPMALDDAAKGIRNLKYLSPEFMDAVGFANQTARKLGMRVDITLGSGWPYGGPTTTLALSSSKLKVEYVALGKTPTPAPKLKEGESFIAAFAVNGTQENFDAASAVRFSPEGASPVTSGTMTALYFIASHTGQQVKRPGVGGEGLVLDHMARPAIDEHLKDVAEPLLKAFGDQPPTSVFSDSLEVYGADWTPTLPAEFLRRRGYDLIPHLPELLAGNTTEAASVRHDWALTMSDLVRENYLAPVTEFAAAHHTKFRSQTYGFPPAILADEATPQLPEGEGPQWRAFSFTRWASSASHLYNRNVTSAETWTWLHSPVFRATPLDMKVEADRMLLEGVNQFVGHGWPYSPDAAGEPGWSLYAAAVFNAHNPWFAVMPEVTGYLTRMSWLLRQGKPTNDVAILLPEDDVQASIHPNGRASITEAMKEKISPALMAAILDAGYNIDYIDARTIEKLGTVPYPVLVVPPTERIPLAAYKTVAAYAEGKGKLIGIGSQPTLAPGLLEQKDAPAIAALSEKLFRADGHKGTSIDSVEQLAAALHAALAPDLDAQGTKLDLGFIHRELATSDVYFVVNSSNQPTDATVHFRATAPVVEALDPDTGKALWTADNHPGARFPLTLAPYESRVFVVSYKAADATLGKPEAATPTTLATLDNDWSIRFAGEAKSQPIGKPESWTALSGKKFYSGEAVYTHTVTIDATALKSKKILLDFGAGTPTTDPRPAGANGVRALLDAPLREAAIIVVNGQQVGTLWHPPYQIEVSPALHAGANTIEVHVFNTAMNRMAENGPHDFSPLIAKYGKRFEMQDMNEIAPLPSGILAPVRLVVEPR
jgi:hypothetical protein